MIVPSTRFQSHTSPSNIGFSVPTFFVPFVIGREYAGRVRTIIIDFQFVIPGPLPGQAPNFWFAYNPNFDFGFKTPDKVSGSKFIKIKSSSKLTNFLNQINQRINYDKDNAQPSQGQNRPTFRLDYRVEENELEDSNNPNYQVTFQDFIGFHSHLYFVCNPTSYNSSNGMPISSAPIDLYCQVDIRAENPTIF